MACSAVSSFILIPRYPRTTSPRSRMLRVTLRAMLAGIAKPIPMNPPVRVLMAVLMPMTSPWRLTRGPPLLPGLIAASVWMRLP